MFPAEGREHIVFLLPGFWLKSIYRLSGKGVESHLNYLVKQKRDFSNLSNIMFTIARYM